MQSFLISSESSTAQQKAFKIPLSRGLIYGGLAAASIAFVAIVATCWLLSAPDRGLENACLAWSEMPPIKEQKLISHDATVMASVAGHVELMDGARVSYLPLDFHATSLFHERIYGGPVLVSMVGTCVTLHIKYQSSRADNQPTIVYHGLDLLVRDASKAIGRPEKRCNFESPFNAHQRLDRRYSCRKTQSQRCVASRSDTRTPPVHEASLVLTALEFEVEGDPMILSKREFSKTPLDNSCGLWEAAQSN